MVDEGMKCADDGIIKMFREEAERIADFNDSCSTRCSTVSQILRKEANPMPYKDPVYDHVTNGFHIIVPTGDTLERWKRRESQCKPHVIHGKSRENTDFTIRGMLEEAYMDISR